MDKREKQYFADMQLNNLTIVALRMELMHSALRATLEKRKPDDIVDVADMLINDAILNFTLDKHIPPLLPQTTTYPICVSETAALALDFMFETRIAGDVTRDMIVNAAIMHYVLGLVSTRQQESNCHAS